LKEGWLGIRGLFAFRLDTGQILSRLAQVLLHDPSTLSQGERELNATHVSFLNDCHYCQASHGAIASIWLSTWVPPLGASHFPPVRPRTAASKL
jgi:alkylhydroperoxidase family enzyme